MSPPTTSFGTPHWRRIALGLCALALLALLVACARTPPEQRLRETLGELQTALEQRDLEALHASLADDFVGPDGMDRNGARALAMLSFRRYRDVGVALGPAQIEIQGDRATVRFSAALTGGAGRVLPEAAQVYEVQTGWRESDGEWRMSSAEWKPKL
ncbi:nuclear transport factor 2 family protein [Lysobacter sp. Root604]|uniref:nuclear transport factor 2 family protein n=1 Tax=Lysobacter sp. Root604 TaxID=1736568 RepID=UPI000B22A5BE|nr:nuclear transport factor 2 family protein [Lysobacter sp. Root604]